MGHEPLMSEDDVKANTAWYQLLKYECLDNDSITERRKKYKLSKYEILFNWVSDIDVAHWYQFYTCCEESVPIVHSVKFTKCEIYGSTMLSNLTS